MRVIKQGTLPEDKLYITTCHNCKCEFEFYRKESELVYDYRDGGNFLKINCPCCKKVCTSNIKKD